MVSWCKALACESSWEIMDWSECYFKTSGIKTFPFFLVFLSLHPACRVTSQLVHILRRTSTVCMEALQPTTWTLDTTGSPSPPVWLPVWIPEWPPVWALEWLRVWVMPAQLHYRKLQISTPRLSNFHREKVRVTQTSPSSQFCVAPHLVQMFLLLLIN